MTTTDSATQAMLYQQASTNPIGVTNATATNIGYLATNKTQLEVVGSLTAQDPTDIYSFTYQNSGTVALSLKNLTGNVQPRIILTDSTGTQIIADSAGTSDQKAAFAQLTSGGLDLKQGKYLVKTTYPPGAAKSVTTDYTMQLSSGTYTADYRTLAAATTVQQTLLAGGSIGYSSASATASMLTNISNSTATSTPINIFDYLA